MRHRVLGIGRGHGCLIRSASSREDNRPVSYHRDGILNCVMAITINSLTYTKRVPYTDFSKGVDMKRYTHTQGSKVLTAAGNPFGYLWYQWIGIGLGSLIILGSII